MIRFVYPFIIAYFIGAIPFSYLLGRLVKGIDICKIGSCNPGATNLVRCAGKPLGITALFLDISKGVIVVTVIANLFYTPAFAITIHMFKVMLGLFAVAGHAWSAFLGFKGGKGVATTIGVLIGLSPAVAALGLLTWCLFVAVFKYVSLGSIAMAISVVFFMFIFKQPVEYQALALVLCALIICRHLPNISRIIKGTEYKINRKIK